jgi:hypothetical protein
LQLTDLEFATARTMQRAREAILSGDRKQTFSVNDLDPEAQLPEPGADLNVFGPKSNGRAGMSVRTALGSTERWVSDYCVQTVSAPLGMFPAAESLFAMPMTNCFGPQPRDDLFEHLKRNPVTTPRP